MDHPVIWDSLILGKDLTLNFNNMGPVAKYSAHLKLPAATFGTLAIPTGYLRGNFNCFWTYDAQSQRLTEVTGQVPNGCANGNLTFAFYPNFGGVIISDATTDYAMGVYGVSITSGGPVSFFGLYSYPCARDDANFSEACFWVLSVLATILELSDFLLGCVVTPRYTDHPMPMVKQVAMIGFAWD